MSWTRVACKALFMLAIAMLLIGPGITLVAEAQWTTGGQFINAPASRGIMPGSYTQQPAGLLPPQGPYACPYGYYFDPVRQQCTPASPGYPGWQQPIPYGQPYDPRVV